MLRQSGYEPVVKVEIEVFHFCKLLNPKNQLNNNFKNRAFAIGC